MTFKVVSEGEYVEIEKQFDAGQFTFTASCERYSFLLLANLKLDRAGCVLNARLPNFH